MLPDWRSLDWPAFAIALAAAFVLFKLHWGVLRVLTLAIVLGMGWTLIGTMNGMD
jgi:hypothetical protein